MRKKFLAAALVIVLASALGTQFFPSAQAANGDFVIIGDKLEQYVGPGGDVVIPEGVVTIGGNAFADCESITSITLSSTVSKFDHHIVQGLSEPGPYIKSDTFVKITVDDNNPEYSSLDGVMFNKDMTALIYCPVGRAGKYIVPDSVTTIGERAFENCAKLTEVVIPDSVTSIGESAFQGCSSLAGVTLSNSITNIPCRAFDSCSSLSTVAIPEGVTYIAEYAFAECSEMAEVFLPQSLARIEERAFTGGYKPRVTVYYAGSEEQWQQVDRGEVDHLDNAAMNYNYTYKATSSLSSSSNITAILAAVGVVVLAAGIAVIVILRKKKK